MYFAIFDAVYLPFLRTSAGVPFFVQCSMGVKGFNDTICGTIKWPIKKEMVFVQKTKRILNIFAVCYMNVNELKRHDSILNSLS